MYTNKILTVIIILLFPVLSFADNFDSIKQELSKAGCWRFIFENIIESEIFNSIDSSHGEAYLSSDGRYYINANNDIYIYDLHKYYSYSPESNQLIIDKKQTETDDNISFITDFNKYYDTYLIKINHSYKLLKKEKILGDIPDSMVVYIKSNKKKLDRIEYYDINEELNKLIFIEQIYLDSCLDSLFIPNVPDSIERVKL